MNYNHPVGPLCGASDTTSSQYNYVLMLTMNCSTSLSMPTFGRSGIMWATTLKPASFDRWKDSHTARTVWPLGETYRSAELDYKAWRFSDLSSDRLVSHHVAFSSPAPPDPLTCWCPGPRLRTRSGLRSPAGCSRSPACRWGVASGSSRVASRWWFPHTWCCCAQSICRRKPTARVYITSAHYIFKSFLLRCNKVYLIELFSLTDVGVLYVLGSFRNINLQAGSLHGSLSRLLTLTSH